MPDTGATEEVIEVIWNSRTFDGETLEERVKTMQTTIKSDAKRTERRVEEHF